VIIVRIGDREVGPNGWPRRDAATVVKVLALSPHRSLHRERLMDVLWPEAAPAEAAPRLHKADHYARRALGRPDAVVLRGEMVTLFPGQQVLVDLEQFAAAAEEAIAGGSATDAAEVLDRFPGDPRCRRMCTSHGPRRCVIASSGIARCCCVGRNAGISCSSSIPATSRPTWR
jgi:DNA-binding SARP family transcriptional activator